jgi:hypothetical protein
MKKDLEIQRIKCSIFINTDEGMKQCSRTFNLNTSTTNLATHLRVDHRLNKNGNLLPLSGSYEQPFQMQSNLSQAILQSNNREELLSTKKTNRITSRILAWIVDDMQPFNVLQNEKFRDILYEAESKYEFPCEDVIKQKFYQSVQFSEQKLLELMNNNMKSFAFTMDLWTKVHKPYIGITIHWLSSDFVLYKALLTIESFPYPHTAEHIEDCLHREFAKWNITDKCIAGITDNASSMVKAMRDFQITHIRCTAHTIQLSIIDGLKDKGADLINQAKALNKFIANKDKYREKLRIIQFQLAKQKDPLLLESLISIVDPISSDVSTRWNSTYILLNRLLDLYDAVKKLHENMAKDKDRIIRNDAKTLETLLLNENDLLGIKELVNLLEPFAYATTLMGGDLYPTLSMMLPVIKALQEHLFQMERTLNHLTIREIRDEIELSFSERWEDPGPDGYLAAILDPRFKDFGFEPTKFQSTKEILRQKMNVNINLFYSPTLNVEKNSKSSLLDSLFNETTSSNISPIDTEFKIYFDMPKMPKYDFDDPLYKQHNPLTFWYNNKTTLPLLAQQAQRYLSIPATSVPSERLFSDAGNIITHKRNRLHPNTVHDLLFLKENQSIFNVYPELELE